MVVAKGNEKPGPSTATLLRSTGWEVERLYESKIMSGIPSLKKQGEREGDSLDVQNESIPG
jgi:hypothetical protein